MQTLAKHKVRRKPRRSYDGFESIGDIIRRLESKIIPNHFNADLSLQLDAAHVMRDELREGRHDR